MPRIRRISPEDGRVRYATDEDNRALCELFNAVSMRSELQFAVDRDPDFFRLYKMQQGEYRACVFEYQDKILGLGTILARDGYLFGERRKLGYLCDLRLDRSIRGGHVLGSIISQEFLQATRDFGSEVMFTTIIDSNRAARWALVNRHPAFPSAPLYQPVSHLDIVNIHFTWKHRIDRSIDIRRATNDDIEMIESFLDADHRNRLFGYCFDELLRHQLSNWPDLAIDNFYLAEKKGVLQGIMSTWNPDSVKRYRVIGYDKRMRRMRTAFNLLARLTGSARLPGIGENFRYCYLTHVCIPGDDPRIAAALLRRIYADQWSNGYQFMTTLLMRDDPLEKALRGFQVTRVPATLYAVTLPESHSNQFGLLDTRPGIEACFA
jgi:N-acetylglutamate synthase-like GNAT family acetyltransferase